MNRIIAIRAGALLCACGLSAACNPDPDPPTRAADGAFTISPESVEAQVDQRVVFDVQTRGFEGATLEVDQLPEAIAAGPGVATKAVQLSGARSDHEVVLICDDVVSEAPVRVLLTDPDDEEWFEAVTVKVTCTPADPPTLSISPANVEVPVGSPFTITAQVEGGGDFIYPVDLPPGVSWDGGGVSPEDGLISDPHEEVFTFSCSSIVPPSPLVIELQWGRNEEFLRQSATVECIAPLCGNNVVNDPEQCDGADLDGQTCMTVGFQSGELRCSPECLFDPSNCEDVQGSLCGDIVVEGIEECDDGNTDDGDGCDASCQLECGNGAIDANEQCDDSNRDDGDGCDSTCQSECGNGQIDGSEQCDDGNTDDNDGCDSMCMTEPVCGNAMVEGTEECDGADHNMMTCMDLGYAGGNLACDLLCAFDESGCLDSVCGDASITGTEVCDGAVLGGSDCTSIGMGFDGGTLGCSATCDAYETSACTSPSTACSLDLGFPIYTADCAGSRMAGGASFCTFVNDVFQGTVVAMDQNCAGTPSMVNNESDPIACATNDSGGAMLTERILGPPESSALIPVDAAGMVGAAIDTGFGVGTMPTLAATRTAGAFDGYLMFGGSSTTVHTISPAGVVLQSYAGSSFTTGNGRGEWTHRVGNELHAAVAVEDFSFRATKEARVNGASIDTTTNMLTSAVHVISSWTDSADRPLWSVEQLDSGDLRSWLLPPAATAFTVVPIASGTLTGGATTMVSISNGTITDFEVVHVPGKASVLLAIVDDGAGSTFRAFELPATLPAMLDLSGGTELDANGGAIVAAGAGVDGVVAAFRAPSGGNGSIHFMPLP